jgi:hypothetical protein
MKFNALIFIELYNKLSNNHKVRKGHSKNH